MVLSTLRVVDALPTNENDVTLPVTQVNPAVTFVTHLLGGFAAASSGGGGGEMRSAASASLRVDSRISRSIAFSSSSVAAGGGFSAAAGFSVCDSISARIRRFMVEWISLLGR